MTGIAKFEKVSIEQFTEGWNNCFGSTDIDKIKKTYESINLPKRATAGSAGYDFYSTLDFELQLNNTVGIIDSDYYNSDNEGHIFIKITNDTNTGKTVSLKQGDAFAQGIFVQYGITVDDDATGVRNGGFGSTGK